MDRENRKLPEIEIHGTTFQFDIDTLLLIEKGNPFNALNFGDMEDHGTHYSLEYCAVKKNCYIPLNDPSPEKSINELLDPPILVNIPRIAEIDPLGFSRKYNCNSKEMVEKTDFELMVNQDIYNKRIDGHPVKVNIGGNHYEADPVNDVLWSLDGKEDIELKNLSDYFDLDSLKYNIFYEVETGKAVDIYNTGFGNIEAVRLVQIPHMFFLDPIGKNHAAKFPTTLGLMYHDLKLEHDLNISMDEISQIIPAHRNRDGNMEMLVEGTVFIVDINTFQYVDKQNPENIISLNMLEEDSRGYRFEYKGREILLPEFVILDPEGMARKYHVSIEEVKKHDDFHFMVDQEAYHLRMKGQLPTIDIAGHTFTVDIRMNMLRPATDFGSKGINFDDIDHYYSEENDKYIIPYDPIKREFRELDYDKLLAIPKDLIAIELPYHTKLDPIGCNREGGWDLNSDLKWIGVKSHFEAKVVPWEQTFIMDVIKENEEINRKEQKTNTPPPQNIGRKL